MKDEWGQRYQHNWQKPMSLFGSVSTLFPRPRTCLPWSRGCRYCKWSPGSASCARHTNPSVLPLIKAHPQNFTRFRHKTLPLFRDSALPATFCIQDHDLATATLLCACPCILLVAIYVLHLQQWQPRGSPLQTWCFWMCWTQPLCFFLLRSCVVVSVSPDVWNVDMFFTVCLDGFVGCRLFVAGDVCLFTWTRSKNSGFWMSCRGMRSTQMDR